MLAMAMIKGDDAPVPVSPELRTLFNVGSLAGRIMPTQRAPQTKKRAKRQ